MPSKHLSTKLTAGNMNHKIPNIVYNPSGIEGYLSDLIDQVCSPPSPCTIHQKYHALVKVLQAPDAVWSLANLLLPVKQFSHPVYIHLAIKGYVRVVDTTNHNGVEFKLVEETVDDLTNYYRSQWLPMQRADSSSLLAFSSGLNNCLKELTFNFAPRVLTCSEDSDGCGDLTPPWSTYVKEAIGREFRYHARLRNGESSLMPHRCAADLGS